MEFKDIRDDFTSDVYNTLDFLPTNNEANRIIDSFDRAVNDAIIIPKGATNGEVITAMFPNIEAGEIKTDTGGYIEVKYLDTTDKCDATAFRKNWWNAPYKRGSENG